MAVRPPSLARPQKVGLRVRAEVISADKQTGIAGGALVN